MAEGIFIRKKPILWNTILFLCGLFSIFIYAFLQVVDSQATNGILTFLLWGIMLCTISLILLLMNHKAYIRIEDGHIHAKYHWFGKLDCSIDEVDFALAQINTLILLLKSGKRHVIRGIENSWALSSAIRRQTFSIEKKKPDTMRQQLELIQATRKKELFWVLGGIVLMFANIFIAVFLTGGKEIYDFSKLDWTLFSIMGAIELLTVTGTFYAAQRYGKHLLPIKQLKHRIKGALIASQSLPSGNAKYVYTDENHIGRMIVYSFPNDESVYYCVQEFTGNFTLETVHTSEVFQREDDLPIEAIESFIDISSQFL